MRRQYIIIDYDGNLMGPHVHNILSSTPAGRLLQGENEYNQNPNEASEELKKKLKEATKARWELVKDMKPRGPEGRWLALINRALKEGHCIAFASFNDYRDVMILSLEHILGLSPEVIRNIPIKNGLPLKQSEQTGATKVKYIKEILAFWDKDSAKKIKLKDVLLIDDSEANCLAAEAADIQAIHSQLFVNFDGEIDHQRSNQFFEDIEEHLDWALEENEISSSDDEEEESEEACEEKLTTMDIDQYEHINLSNSGSSDDIIAVKKKPSNSSSDTKPSLAGSGGEYISIEEMGRRFQEDCSTIPKKPLQFIFTPPIQPLPFLAQENKKEKEKNGTPLAHTMRFMPAIKKSPDSSSDGNKSGNNPAKPAQPGNF